MATFQKLMSYSPRAIRQALRRRLLVLLAREQMAVEARVGKHGPTSDLAEWILRLREEMRALALAILNRHPSGSARAEADTFIAQVKQD